MMNRYFLFLTLIFHSLFSFSQRKAIDSLQQINYNKLDEKGRVSWHTAIAKAYLDVDVDSTILWSKKGLEVAEKAGAIKEQASLNLYWGISEFRSDNATTCLRLYNRSLELSRSIKDTVGIAMAMNNLAGLYFIVMDDEKAKEMYKEAAYLFGKMGKFEKVGACYNNLTLLMNREETYDSSLYYAKEAIKLYEQGYPINTGFMFDNYGSVFAYMEQYDSALKYFQLALDEWQKKGSRFHFSSSYFNLGAVYVRKNMFDSARKYFTLYEALVAEHPSNNMTALHYLESKLEMFEKTGEKDSTIHYLWRLADQYNKTFDENKILAAKRQEIKMFNEQLEQENEKLKYEYEISTESNQRLQAMLILLITSLLIVLVVSAFLFREYKRRKTLLLRLQNSNEMIMHQQEELQHVNQTLEEKVSQRTFELEENNKTLREFTHFNSHKLRRHISNIKGLSDLLDQKLSTSGEVLPMIKSEIDELDNILRELDKLL